MTLRLYRVNEKGDNVVMLDAHVRRELEAGAFAFIDAGCASGESIDHCQRRFQLGRGLGLDWYGQDLAVARNRGLAAAHCDLVSEPLPDRCVEFTSMVDFLEHLPDLETSARVLRKFARASRQFLFIRHPSFDDGDYLARLGLKLAWTDWSAHPNPIRLEEFRAVFDRLGFERYDVIPDQPILDSSHPAVLPVTAPSDTEEYDAAIHEPKPFVTFDRVVYGKYDIFVCLDPNLPEDAWRRLASIDGWRAVWESPSAKRRAREPGQLAHVLDALTRRYASAGPQPTPTEWANLQTLVEREVRAVPRRAVQLIHVLDAFGRTSGVQRVFGTGDDASLPAAYLAARFPFLQIDLANPEPNAYDFVFAADSPHGGRQRRREDLDRWTRPDGWSCVAAIDSTITESIERLLDRLEDGPFAEILADALALARLDLDPARRARLNARRDAGIVRAS